MLFFLLLAAAVVLAGCGADRPRPGGEIVLAAARDLAPGQKDPYFASSILEVWEPLVGISDEGRPVPVLAESWESNEDRTQWTFHLKKGVLFQDGRPFDAGAVAANFERYTNMGYRASSFYGFSAARIYPGLLKTEQTDDHTVRLYFKKPVPMLIYRMAGWGSAMFSPDCFDRNTGDFIKTVSGTGPFYISERVPDRYTVLRRNESYYGAKAQARQIKIRVIPSPETRYSAMKSGEILGVLDLGGMPPVLAEELLKDSRFQKSVCRTTISHYLSLNGTRFPFQDERMRRAVNLAVDREKIVKYYFRGFGTPTAGFLNSMSPFGRVVPSAVNLSEAMVLSQEVLQGKRQTVRFLLPQYGTERYPYKIIAEFLQAELKPLGLDVKIDMMDSLTYRSAMARGDYDIAISTRGLGNLDPTELLYDYFDSRGSSNLSGHLGYSNPEVDRLFEQLQSAYSLSERRVLYDRLLAQLQEHPAVVPLLEDQNLAVSSRRLAGYQASVYGITLDRVHWAEGSGAGS